MAKQTGTMGLGRLYAIVFGLAYLAVAALEIVLLATGTFVEIGNVTIFKFALLQNIIHWTVGLVVFGSFFAGEYWAKYVARIVGVVFVLVSLLGIFLPKFTGQLLGFSGNLPFSYTVVHILTAAAALTAGFVARAETRRRPVARVA
jgi:hypothetical protein